MKVTVLWNNLKACLGIQALVRGVRYSGSVEVGAGYSDKSEFVIVSLWVVRVSVQVYATVDFGHAQFLQPNLARLPRSEQPRGVTAQQGEGGAVVTILKCFIISMAYLGLVIWEHKFGFTNFQSLESKHNFRLTHFGTHIRVYSYANPNWVHAFENTNFALLIWKNKFGLTQLPNRDRAY